MKQRVAIARGMAMEPDILLMDEPFAALDALTRRKMQDELLQLWEDTRFTVLFVTHSIPEAVRIGNRILLLSPHPGQVKAELNSDGPTPADAQRRAALRPHPSHAVRRRQSRRRSRSSMSSTPGASGPSTCASRSAKPTSASSTSRSRPWERIWGNGCGAEGSDPRSSSPALGGVCACTSTTRWCCRPSRRRFKSFLQRIAQRRAADEVVGLDQGAGCRATPSASRSRSCPPSSPSPRASATTCWRRSPRCSTRCPRSRCCRSR